MTDTAPLPSPRWPASALRELVHRPAGQLPALDGLRALAVLLVICDHWVAEWVPLLHLPAPSFVRFPALYWGWTGVDLFFVLSGFLIGKQLWGELHRSGTIGVTQFVLRRGLRIWPLYYVTMLILLLVPSRHAPQWPDWVMLSNYIATSYARSWSLSTEEQFYLFMPTFLVACRRWVPSRAWPAAIVVLIGAVCASRAVTYAHLSTQALTPERISVLMYSAFHLHCEALLIGLLIAWIATRRREWITPPATGAPAYRVMVAAAVLAITGIALRMLNREVFAYLALGCVYGAALVIALADQSIITSPLRWRIWYPIARLSFGMYLNHLILREPTDTIVNAVNAAFGYGTDAAFLAGLLFTILASAMTAALTFVCVEQPGLAFRDRWLEHRAVRRVTVPVFGATQ